jgi:quinol monooxygenase YgiN
MPKVKHISLFQFKESAAPDQVENLFQELLDVTETVPGIEDYVWGPNCSAEGLNQGYTYGFVMSFRDAEARDAYLAHAEQGRIKNALKSHAEAMLVFDFEL